MYVPCEVCGALLKPGAHYRDHVAACEKLRRDRLKIEAVDAANHLGIYAVPTSHAGKVYWKPRLSNGNDPDLGWLIASSPTFSGWLSWSDAVLALQCFMLEEISKRNSPQPQSDP